MQVIFGGRQILTGKMMGEYFLHDMWYDNNNNFFPDKGDKVTWWIGKQILTGEPAVEINLDEAVSNGVDVQQID